MFRRSIVALSHHRLRSLRPSSSQVTSFGCPTRKFSTASPKNAPPKPPASTNKPPPPAGSGGGGLSKFIVGGVVIGTCLTVAYSRGYLDEVLGKNQPSLSDALKVQNKTSVESSPSVVGGSGELLDTGESPVDVVDDARKREGEEKVSTEREAESLRNDEDLRRFSYDIQAKGEEIAETSSAKETAEDSSSSLKLDENVDVEISVQKPDTEQHEAIENKTMFSDASAAHQLINPQKGLPVEVESGDESKDLTDEQKPSTSLLETYDLREEAAESTSMPSSGETTGYSSPKASLDAFGDSSDAHESKDGKLIVDFLQAIHAAEKRQAELDARVFAEEKKKMKDKYEKEWKDARARELMYAEEVAMLEKEVERERAKAAAALKSLQERAEERLKAELEQKEREAESKLKELEELSKAELAASLAREKAAQMEKMAEADLNINALCMAFYARSEKERQTHSIHKLALGTLALEYALANGLPVQAELDAMKMHIEDFEKDPLLQLAFASLPEDVRLHGTDSPLQLIVKLDELRGSLRHFSLIPSEGAGILAHALARLASLLKVKETDRSGDGIESLINKVESLVAQRKLAEAADTLEDGVKGSQAAEVVTDWLRRARNRAITEQAFVLLQTYATSTNLN